MAMKKTKTEETKERQKRRGPARMGQDRIGAADVDSRGTARPGEERQTRHFFNNVE